MNDMAPSTFEAVASAVKAAFDAEFAVEGYTMLFDNLHESLGRQRVSVGIAPIEEYSNPNDAIVQETYLEVRFYHMWKQEISPETVMNPTLITGYADRFRQCLRVARAQDPGTGQLWFFDVQRVTYPNDPTGNKTRFHATIRAYGNNTNLIETLG